MSARHYLLVDDNRAFADNLAEILRDLGDQATVAESGEEALREVERTHFSAVLTDMRMPTLGGGALIHELRKVDPALPAIAITAFTADAELGQAKREGLLAVLPKPVPIATLISQLEVARRGGLVALVGDEPQPSENLTEALRERGFSAVSARSVLETGWLAPVRPFAALIEFRTVGGDHGEALARFRDRYPDVPVLVIADHAGGVPEIPHAARVFPKPFRTEELLSAVEALWAGGPR